MIQDYPKMIYKDGVIGSDYRIVNSETEEELADGYSAFDADKTTEEDQPAVRRGRPPKA